MSLYIAAPRSEEIYHFGILGMKWGVRRYQNPDGSLTPAGQKRYSKKEAKRAVKEAKEKRKAIYADRKRAAANSYLLDDEELDKRIKRLEKENKLKSLTDTNIPPSKAEQIKQKIMKDLEDAATKEVKKYAEYRLDSFQQSLMPEYAKYKKGKKDKDKEKK